MPKIDLRMSSLHDALGVIDRAELERLLEYAKAEVAGISDDVYRIELHDTNRPDLWSEVGLLRQLRFIRGEKISSYPFFSSHDTKATYHHSVEVEEKLRTIRPHIAAFIARGEGINKDFLVELIQMQEKLSEGYGRRRSSLAIGVYRADDIQFPIRYRAVDPTATSFRPLHSDREMNLREILSEHPVGKTYSSLLNDLQFFPYLDDNTGQTLSLPPIINSDDLGRIEVGDANLFVECTGHALDLVLLGSSILACNLADSGFEIEPIAIRYSWDIPVYGRTIVTPFFFQESMSSKKKFITKLLGEELTDEQYHLALEKMGLKAQLSKDSVHISIPPYRNDFLHSVDLAEDVMVGHGLSSFTFDKPHDFTIGRLHPSEKRARRMRQTIVGMGYQEMIFNYLGSFENFVKRIYPPSSWEEEEKNMVSIDNPISTGYAYLRRSPLSNFLESESVSSHAVYPHALFEVGKACEQCLSSDEGTLSFDCLGFFLADKNAGFNTIHRHVSALCYYLGWDYERAESADARFIMGRCVEITTNQGYRGIYGELHPRLLQQWNIQMPSVYAEIRLVGMESRRP